MDQGERRVRRGSALHEALPAASMGWDLAVPIFGGVLLGYLLDRRLGTDAAFTLGLLALGVATGYYNVFRAMRRLEARRQQRPRSAGSPAEETE